MKLSSTLSTALVAISLTSAATGTTIFTEDFETAVSFPRTLPTTWENRSAHSTIDVSDVNGIITSPRAHIHLSDGTGDKYVGGTDEIGAGFPAEGLRTAAAINDFVVGEEYTVTFSQMADIGLTGGTGFATSRYWDVTMFGVTQSSTPIPNSNWREWNQESLTFTATATSSTLEFTVAGGEDSVSWIFLDNATVAQIPEPSAGILLAIGAAGSVLVRRRRNPR